MYGTDTIKINRPGYNIPIRYFSGLVLILNIRYIFELVLILNIRYFQTGIAGN